MLSVSEYAKEKGISVRSVWRKVKSGELNTVKQGRTTYIVDRGSVTGGVTSVPKELCQTVTSVPKSVTPVTGGVTSVTEIGEAIERIREQIGELTDRMTKLERDGRMAEVVSGKRGRVTGRKPGTDIFKEARDKGITVKEMLRRGREER